MKHWKVGVALHDLPMVTIELKIWVASTSQVVKYELYNTLFLLSVSITSVRVAISDLVIFTSLLWTKVSYY